MITEDAIADLFEKVVQDLDPAVHAIVIQAELRGRRLRARRRAWLALGTGLVVAAVAGTALAVPLAPAHPGAARLAAGGTRHHASTRHAGTSHARPKPSPPGRLPGRPSGRPSGRLPKLAPGYEMTTKQILRVLERLLPAGSTVSNLNPYTVDGALEADYNDGRGAVDLMIDMEPTVMFTNSGPIDCPKPLWQNEGPRPPGALPVSCVMRTLSNGSVERDAVMYADSYGYYGYNIYDQRPDGITVFIQVANGINHTLPQVDRARPPGTLGEWEALAENPAWHLKKGWHLEN
jgi:hypothetical protein